MAVVELNNTVHHVGGQCPLNISKEVAFRVYHKSGGKRGHPVRTENISGSIHYNRIGIPMFSKEFAHFLYGPILVIRGFFCPGIRYPKHHQIILVISMFLVKDVYKRQEYDCRAKVFTQMKGELKKQIGSPDFMILFTGTVSHKMVNCALIEARRSKLPVERAHTSSLNALREILDRRCLSCQEAS